MQRKPCMSEYFCHGTVYNEKTRKRERCNCSEQDVLAYSASKGLLTSRTYLALPGRALKIPWIFYDRDK
jgi:hypothetical protein